MSSAGTGNFPTLRETLPQIHANIEAGEDPPGFLEMVVRTADGRLIRIGEMTAADLELEVEYMATAKEARAAEQAVWDDAETRGDYSALMHLLKAELSAHLAAGNLEAIRGLMDVISEPLRSEVLRLIDSRDMSGLSSWIESLGGVR